MLYEIRLANVDLESRHRLTTKISRGQLGAAFAYTMSEAKCAKDVESLASDGSICFQFALADTWDPGLALGA